MAWSQRRTSPAVGACSSTWGSDRSRRAPSRSRRSGPTWPRPARRRSSTRSTSSATTWLSIVIPPSVVVGGGRDGHLVVRGVFGAGPVADEGQEDVLEARLLLDVLDLGARHER